MKKTFEDLVRRASQMYKLIEKDAESYIVEKLKKLNLSKLSLVCYSNWADNDCLTQKEIAEWLGITQQTVAYHLNKLRKIWPHLFNFGVKVPPLKYMPRLPEDYEQSTEAETQIQKSF